MSVYTILLAISIFMIALVLLIIQQTFFRWQQDIDEEIQPIYKINRPAVSIMITKERCVLQKRNFSKDILVYDNVSRGSITSLASVSMSVRSVSVRSAGKDDSLIVLATPGEIENDPT